MIMYMFGILFAQATADYMNDDNSRYSLAYSAAADPLRNYFGTLPRSVYTCFKSILGGMDWENAAWALSDVGGFFVVMFIVMVTFVYLAVLNVISGLFLQTSLE